MPLKILFAMPHSSLMYDKSYVAVIQTWLHFLCRDNGHTVAIRRRNFPTEEATLFSLLYKRLTRKNTKTLFRHFSGDRENERGKASTSEDNCDFHGANFFTRKPSKRRVGNTRIECTYFAREYEHDNFQGGKIAPPWKRPRCPEISIARCHARKQRRIIRCVCVPFANMRRAAFSREKGEKKGLPLKRAP